MVRTKLQSNRGASIAFALLLFLVCTMVGAVVLTAGTAAAGTLSKTAEMDRKYYAVASAADLLAQELDGAKVTIVREKTTETTVAVPHTIVTETNSVTGAITVNDTEGAPEPPDVTTSYRTTVYCDDVVPAAINKTIPNASISGEGTLLAREALYLLFGGNACNNDAAMGYTFGSGGGRTVDFALTHAVDDDADGVSADALAITGTVELKNSGTLVFLLKSAGSDAYQLRLTLTASTSDNDDTTESDAPSVKTETADGYKISTTTTTTRVRTSTITWTVADIEKVVS